MPEIVLVDGYNLLLALAAREGVDPDPAGLALARRRLVGLLGDWAVYRSVDVAVAWDGRRARPYASTANRGGRDDARAGGGPGRPDAVRETYLEPPAEADDWLVYEATRLWQAGKRVAVVSRDRGLLARLPAATRVHPLEELAIDLESLLSGPLRAPHVRGPGAAAGDIPFSSVPPGSRLPRRHGSAARSGAGSVPAATQPLPDRRGSGSPGASTPGPAPEDPRAAATARKELRRRRHERARRRKI